MKEAMFYKTVRDDILQCELCPQFCVLKPGDRGKCHVRENKNGKLYSLVYAKPCSIAIDPVEKKPLFHFLPGSKTFSISTVGCNLDCKACQNWEISQANPEDVPAKEMQPEEVVAEALKHNCESISYTYIEPSIFFEYVLDIAKLARQKGLKNIMVTNGFLNPEPIQELYKYIDAANIDLKSFSEEFYKDMCEGRLQPVLDAIKQIKSMGVWIEITTLVIPGQNDNREDIRNMFKWIKANVGADTPVHFSRFFPCYKLLNIEPTPIDTLRDCYEIATEVGLKYIYVGNVLDTHFHQTVCPKCGMEVIDRSPRYELEEVHLEDGACKFCKTRIAGRF
jgi:pyruvate formate lyase activating enzyme